MTLSTAFLGIVVMASIFKSLLHTVTGWCLNVTFLSVDIIGHF